MSLYKNITSVLTGRSFGNKISSLIPMNQSLFHSALEESGVSGHLHMLSQIKRNGHSPVEVLPNFVEPLLKGLEVIENRYGPQNNITSARNALKALRDDLSVFAEDNNNKQFDEVYGMVKSYLNMTTMMVQDKMGDLTNEELKRFFAFELGVLQWYDNSFIRQHDFKQEDQDEDGDIMFYNFLIYYSKQKYEDTKIFDYYMILLRSHGMLRERELGYDSANISGDRPGLARQVLGGKNLMDAIGRSWP